MKLHSRPTLIAFTVAALLTIVCYCATRTVIESAFEKAESELLDAQVSHVHSALEKIIDNHAAKLVDWAQWDDTYAFMAGRAPTYVSENISQQTLTTLHLDAMLFFTNPDKLHFGVISQSGRLIPATKQFIEPLAELLRERTGMTFREIARIDGELFIVVGTPISSTDGTKPARGFLVATARIDESVYKLIRNRANLNITFWNTDRLPRTAETAPLFAALRAGKSFVAKPASDEIMYSYGINSDFKGEPVLLFRIEQTRMSRITAAAICHGTLATMVGLGILAAIALTHLIQNAALNRVRALSKAVRQATEEREPVRRLLEEEAENPIRRKLIQGIIAVITLQCTLSLIAFVLFYSWGIARFDTAIMQESLERASQVLQARLEDLSIKVMDWANWDDTYRFVIDRNSQYRADNIRADSLTKIKVSYILYFDAQGKLVEGGAVGADRVSLAPLSDTIRNIFAGIPALSLARTPTTGYVASPLGPIFAAASPIHDTARKLPARGALVFASLVNDEAAHEVSQQVKQNVRLEDSSFSSPSAPATTFRLGSHDVRGTRIIPDLLGAPALKIRIDSERVLAQSAFDALKSLVFVFAGAAVLFSVAMAFIIEQVILSRISALSAETATLLKSHEIPLHRRRSREDEVSELAVEINGLMETLQSTRLELDCARAEAKRAADDAAAAANMAKSNFVAKVSHELRTPIHSILGLVRIVRKGTTDENSRSHLGMVRDSALGLLGVVNDILDFSRSEVGLLSVNTQAMNLRDAIRGALRIIAPRVFERIEKNPIECVASVDEAIPELILGDAKRLSQVLVNLLGNSIKFTAKGHVSLTVNKISRGIEGDWLQFTVEDTGLGIPKEKLDLIFEPFQQVDDSVSRQYQGTGLGLTIVKQLVTAMGGTIHVESVINTGSRFIFELPLRMVNNTEPPYVQDLRNSKVWIIDNAELESTFVAQAFNYFGASVTEHTTGSLRLLDLDQIEIARIDKLAVAGNALASQRTWTILKKFIDLRGGQEVLVFLSPHELTYREQLRSLAIHNILLTPLIAQESARSFTGNFKEDFEGYDDFIDFTPTSKKALEILIADDLVTNQIVLRCMLNDMGHRVTAVNNGQELIDALAPRLGLREKEEKDKEYDLILTDVQMPILDGVSAVMRIREREDQLDLTEDRRLPILLVTAHVLAEEQARINGAGADGVITKPIDTKELELTIDRLSERAQNRPTRSASFQLDMTQEGEIRGIMQSVDYVLSAIREIDQRINRSAPGDPSGTGQPLIDTELLRDRVKHDRSRFKVLLDSYDLTLKSLITGLEKALSEESAHEIESHAHALRGCLGEIGCQSGVNAAADVVLLNRGGSHQMARQRAEELLPIVQRAHQVVTEALATAFQ